MLKMSEGGNDCTRYELTGPGTYRPPLGPGTDDAGGTEGAFEGIDDFAGLCVIDRSDTVCK
jgi:hypothetical protein